MADIRFMYGKPNKKIKYYFVVSNLLEDKVFWRKRLRQDILEVASRIVRKFSNICGGNWLDLNDFVKMVCASESKVVVLLFLKEEIEIIEKIFKNA